MSKKIAAFLLAFLTFAFTVFPANASEISVSARSACLICADNGEILYEKNSRERLPMASTTKIMTCLVALESSKLSDTVRIGSGSAGIEGSSLYLSAGDSVTLEDLLYALMLRSANDAADAIACHVAGSVEAFADIMNEKAKELGLEDTHFTNPHGLPDDDHYTSARDFAVLGAYAMKQPSFRQIAGTVYYTVKVNGNEERQIANHNRLLRQYEGANGVKTGFTKASGRCLVTSAERDGISLVAVTLNAPDDWRDHERMLDFGFSELQNTKVVSEGETVDSLKVAGYGEVPLICREEKYVITSKNALIEKKIYREHLSFAPVSKNEPAGLLEIFAGGKSVAKIPLYPKYEITVPEEKSFFSKLKDFFTDPLQKK